MHRATRLFAGLFVLMLLLSAYAQEKVQLVNRAKAGQTMRYRLNATLTVEAAGRSFNLEISSVTVQKVLEVSPEGNIKQEQTTESYEMTFSGQKMPTPEEALKDRTVTVIKPNGEPVSRESEREQEDAESKHISQAFAVIFPANPVGVGDKWSYTFKEDSKLGTAPGTLEYTLKGFEQWRGIRVARVASSYTANDESKINASVELLIEVRTGDTVYASGKVEGMSFGAPDSGASATGQFEYERIEGTPLPEGEEVKPSTQPAKPDAKQDNQQSAEKKPEQPEKTDQQEKSDTKSDTKKKEKTIDDVVKDFEKLEGLFTLYRKKEAGKDTLYMAIREDQLDKLYFLQATVSEGIPTFLLAAGTPINDLVFKFVRRDDQILLVEPNLRFQADPRKPIARSVRRSFADAYLEAFKIEVKDKEGKTFLIDVSNFFRSDLMQIQQLASVAAGGSYSIDREKTTYLAIKAFPNNLFVQTAYHFAGGAQRGGGLGGLIAGLGGGAELADPRSLPITVNYNLWELPVNNGYRPRLYDPRIGYFYTEFLDFTTDQPQQEKRYILRWHLEKADPNAPLSPPKEPIVFWLDNAIPEEYRDAVREGILEWNKAFEKIGIKDAIVVKQMPDDADWDHADMRYNVIRWVSSPNNGYAVALFRANPLTGQILNASITVDGNMARITRYIYQREVDPLAAFREAEAWEKGLHHHHHHHNHCVCTLAEGSMFRAWTGYLMMDLLAPGRNATRTTEDQFVKDYIRSVVMHEMGHILGLRHNFVASRLHSLDELANGELVRKQGTVASVMEYDPFNQMALHSPNTVYWNPTIGSYDYWAIEYGYKQSGINSPEAEKPFLNEIARRNTEPGLAFETDDYADRFDPYVTRFDLGRDPIAYWELTLKDTSDLVRALPSRFPRPGESYYEFTRVFFSALANYSTASVQLTRFIGALQIRRNFRDDPNAQPPLQPVDSATQRRALNLLVRYIFSEGAFNLPKSYYDKLAPNPARSGGPIPPDAPVRDFVSNIQRLTLTRLLAPDTLRRVVNNEFKLGDTKNAFTLAEMFRTLQDAVWSEVGTGKPVSALRRLLQRAHLQQLTDLLVKNSPAPDDAKMLARYHLRRLHAQLKQTLPKVQDDYTRAHYSEAIDTIEKALNAQYMLGMPEFRVPSLAELLGLGRE